MELDLTEASVLEIAQFYAISSSDWLRANMVMSSDGHFEDTNGSSKGLSSPLDLKVLLTLRALSDVVLVGATTVRKENYQTPKLRGEYAKLNEVAPRLVILSRTLDFDLGSRLFADQDNKPIFLSTFQSEKTWQRNHEKISQVAEVTLLNEGFSVTTAISYLHSVGFSKITSEGGLSTLVELVDANLVQELDITMSPVSVGIPATRTIVHDAIDKWPNRVSAKIGQHRIWRIKR